MYFYVFSLCNNSSSNCPHLYTYMFIHVSFCFLRVCACLAFVSARPKLEKRRSTVKAVSMISIIPIYSSAPSPQHDCCYMYAPYIYIYASRSERDRENCPSGTDTESTKEQITVSNERICWLNISALPLKVLLSRTLII